MFRLHQNVPHTTRTCTFNFSGPLPPLDNHVQIFLFRDPVVLRTQRLPWRPGGTEIELGKQRRNALDDLHAADMPATASMRTGSKREKGPIHAPKGFVVRGIYVVFEPTLWPKNVGLHEYFRITVYHVGIYTDLCATGNEVATDCRTFGRNFS